MHVAEARSKSPCRFRGAMPYVVSPLTEEGTVDRPVPAALCRRLIASGVRGITPLGSTGGFACLDEPRRLVDFRPELAGGGR